MVTFIEIFGPPVSQKLLRVFLGNIMKANFTEILCPPVPLKLLRVFPGSILKDDLP